MSKPGIPFRPTQDTNRNEFESSVKQTLDEITGQSRNSPKLSPLPSGVTLDKVIAQMNAILARLQ